jgi:hypothetical protein
MEYGEESVGKKREFPVKVVKKIYVLKEKLKKKIREGSAAPSKKKTKNNLYVH